MYRNFDEKATGIVFEDVFCIRACLEQDGLELGRVLELIQGLTDELVGVLAV